MVLTCITSWYKTINLVKKLTSELVIDNTETMVTSLDSLICEECEHQLLKDDCSEKDETIFKTKGEKM